MEMDDHDKHLLALIDARRPSSSSNKTRNGGMSSRPKIKKRNKVTFSDPLTQHPQPTTESRTTLHEKDVFNGNHPSVVLDNATNFAAGNDHQGNHLDLAGDTSKQDINSVSAAGGDSTTNLYSHDVSTTRNSQRSWSIQQQLPKEIEVSSFSRFSGGQAGSKYDFKSVENLLKNDSSLSSTNSTSISSPPPIDITPPVVFLKNPQEENR
jgi:hypothetical protein